MKNRDRHLHLLHIPSLLPQHTHSQTHACTQKSLWPCGGFCSGTAELVIWKDQIIVVNGQTRRMRSQTENAGKNGEDKMFLFTGCGQKTYHSCPRKDTTIPLRVKMFRVFGLAPHQR